MDHLARQNVPRVVSQRVVYPREMSPSVDSSSSDNDSGDPNSCASTASPASDDDGMGTPPDAPRMPLSYPMHLIHARIAANRLARVRSSMNQSAGTASVASL